MSISQILSDLHTALFKLPLWLWPLVILIAASALMHSVTLCCEIHRTMLRHLAAQWLELQHAWNALRKEWEELTRSIGKRP